MTILTLDRKELEDKIGKITKEVEEKITLFGTPVEEINNKEVSIEIFPNRPDLLNLHNFALAFNQFNEKESIAKVKINEGEKNYVVEIEKSVKDVRPYTVCAIVKDLKLDGNRIKEIIDLQEKLHGSLGRKRRKVAIGIYPLDKIKLPITFSAKKPSEISFVPLDSNGISMTGNQILKNHPAGLAYGDLLKGKEVFPIFSDANGKILSMPPIINSEETGRVSEKTKEVFIECSGHNLYYLKKCLNIIVLALSLMGGKIYSMKIKDHKEKDMITPDMEMAKMQFKIEDINKTLGLELKEKEIKNYLAKMGLGYENEKGKSFALIPSYRTDILHWIDLTEEVAIAYGYENFEAEIPKISTIGLENKNERTKKVLSEILAGTGLLETSTFHLISKDDAKKMHYDYKDFIEVEASKTEANTLRIDLMSNLLHIFSQNSDCSYPQKIFEVGRVFEKDVSLETGIKETERLAVALIDEKISFTDAKQILDYLFKMLDIEYSIENTEDNNYIAGRVGAVKVNGKKIGVIGEIAPRVLRNWNIRSPVVGLEIDLGFLMN